MFQFKTISIKEALTYGLVFENIKFKHYQTAYNVLERLSNKYDVG